MIASKLCDNRSAFGRIAVAFVIAAVVAAPATAQTGTSVPATAATSKANEADRLYQRVADLARAGRHEEAAPIARRVLEIRERTLGREHPQTLMSVNALAELYRAQGGYAEAEPLHRRALDARDRMLGRSHPDSLTSVNNLAGLYRDQARYAEAEPLYLRALTASEQVRGVEHPDTLILLSNLATLYGAQGRYSEAEPLVRRALEASERLLGRDHRDTLITLGNLAALYKEQGRFSESLPLFRRAMEASERVRGAEHPNTLIAISNLASAYHDQRRYAEAELLYRRALEASERVLGRDHPGTLITLANLATLYGDQDNFAEAEPLYRRALEASERVRGRDHPNTVTMVNNLAGFYEEQGRSADAALLLQRALETRLRVLGGSHPYTLRSAEELVGNYLDQPMHDAEVLTPARLLLAGLRRRRDAGGADQLARVQRDREASTAAQRFVLFADSAWSAAASLPDQRDGLRAETFEALQDAVVGAADRSIAQQAARRYASGRNGDLAGLLVERQQAEDEWSQIDQDMAGSFADGPGSTIDHRATLRARLEQVQSRIGVIDARLRVDAPDYFSLIRPTTVDVAAAQLLLDSDEALLLTVPSAYGTHNIAVTRDSIQWERADWNAARVGEAVQQLRWDAAQSNGTAEQIATEELAILNGRPRRFDRATAYALYQQVVAPVAAVLRGKRQIYVAAGGTLATIPFALLVTAPPTGADDDAEALRATRWFGDDVALIHIPSVQSLSLLRRAAAVPRQVDGFFGVGDPVLNGVAQGRGRGVLRSTTVASRMFRPGRTRDGGPVIDLAVMREMARLPGTARELEAVRSALGAPPSSLLLDARATEANVRAADLSNARILLFSTHGLTASQAAGVDEAGLVLTPPSEALDGNDGFLAASEVTTLQLNADWVILSACNTATGEQGEGLGGLARAFFYAGARNLLASHWPVSDDVAPILITRTLTLERSGTPRAEAFRLAMREIRMDTSHDAINQSWAHPFYWAPFVLVGDGGSNRPGH